MGKSAFKFTMYKETNCLEDKIESIMKADNMLNYHFQIIAQIHTFLHHLQRKHYQHE